MAADADFQSDSWMSRKLAYLSPGLLYNCFVVSFITMTTAMRIDIGDVDIRRFGRVVQLLFFLDDDAFALLSISVYVSTLLVLMPVWIGWVVLAIVGNNFLSGNSPVMLGYMVMLSTCFAYFTLPLIPFPAIVRWFSLGVHFIALKLPCLFVGFLSKILQNPSKSNLISSHSPVGFFGISLHSSDIATSLVDSH
ncbi:unnamed protein product [Eruca vesicaria subsp. sativa]|uniref:Uncharacterized protein n=1 Tax=Eruca vesicaria subsp. sativa TaxID=29727 RepID=A0ABC8IPN9_ERUVS|nr:unnamed protein product [Eruca vesicaria subsp. sativa]